MTKTYNLYNLEAPFEEYLDAGNQKPISIKNYLSDFRHFAGWVIFKLKVKSEKLKVEIMNEVDFAQQIDYGLVEEYKSYLSENNIPHKTINRRLSTLRKFCSFCISQGWMKENPAKKITNIKYQITNLVSDNKAIESPKIVFSIKYQVLSILKKIFKPLDRAKRDDKQSPPSSIIHDPSSNFGFQQYVAFLIILIFISVMGAGIYNQFFVKNQASLAYPTALTKAGRILSFQGRLTDTLSNPITTATNVVFQLYSVSSGGVALYNTGTCSTTPDQDGIFSSLIGSDCGAEITNSVFTENANVYLGVTVGGDAEMTPRQQIANVGYAINSETLQGLPPGTGTSVIPYINVDGNLLISASAPGIRSTSASTDFTLSSAKATVIQSAGTGDIVLQATESGTLKFRTGGITDAYTRIAVDNLGNVGIGTTAPAQKLDVAGTAQMTGFKMTTSPSAGYILTSDAAGVGSWADVSSTAGPWTLSGSNLYPDSTAYNVGIGTTAPEWQLTVNSGQIGAGTKASPTDISLWLNLTAGNPNFKIYGWDTAAGTIKYGNLTVGSGGTFQISSSTGEWLRLDSDNHLALNYGADADVSLFWGATSGENRYSYLYGYDTGAAGMKYTRTNVDSSGATNIEAQSGEVMNFLTGGAAKVTIDNSGNVGIGTTAPLYKLQVDSGSIALGPAAVSSTHSIVNARADGGTSNRAAMNFVTNGTSDQSITFDVLDSGVAGHPAAMAIDYTGNVGIGTTAPSGNQTFKTEIFSTSNQLGLAGATNGIGQTVGMSFEQMTNVGVTRQGGAIKSIAEDTYTGGSGGTYDSALALYSSNAGVDSEGLRITSGGNVGIGTTAPAQKLDVAGTAQMTGFKMTTSPSAGYILTSDAVGVGSWTDVSSTAGPWTLAGVNLYPDSTSYNVGIGTTSPLSKLGVLGNLSVGATYGAVAAPTSGLIVEGNVGIGTTNPGALLEITSSPGNNYVRATGNSFSLLSLNSSATPFTVNSTSTAPLIANFQDNGTSVLAINDGGNVGIGTTAPTKKLDVDGKIRASIPVNTEANAIIIREDGADTRNRFAIGMEGVAETLLFNYGADVESSYTTALAIKNNGNVGIGTTAPVTKLQVGGTTSSNYITLAGAATGASYGIDWAFNNPGTNKYAQVMLDYDTRATKGLQINSSYPTSFNLIDSAGAFIGNIMTLLTNGNVGIGTTSPAQKLDIAGTAQMTGFKMTTTPVAGYALVSDTNGVGSWTDVSGSAGPWTLSGSNLYPDSTAYNVGIGTTSPGAYKLNVNGNSNVTGTLNVTTSVSSPTFQGIGAAVTFGNASYGTTIAGSGLTVTPTAWTATPTISGLVTMTSGFDSNTASTVTALTVDGTAGTGDLTINSGETSFTSPATTANANIFYGNSLTSGNLLSLSSTSTALTTGSLASLDWSPGSALTATGDLLSLNIGANGNIGNLFNVKDTGSSLFSVSETAVTSNLPTSFTSSGDVSIAYDLNFTNPTASYIKSAAPFYIQAGETFNSSDLNLKTYNSGDVVLDAGGSTTGTGTVKFYDSNVKGATDTTPIGFAGASSDINTFRTNFTNETVIGSINEAYSAAVGGAGGLWLDGGTYAYPNITYVTDVMVPSGNVGIGATSAGTAKLYVNGNVGIGTTAPDTTLTISNTSSPQLHLRFNSDATDGTAIAGLVFGARADPNGYMQQKGGIFFQRTTDYGRGNLYLAVNNVADNTNASINNAVMTLARGGSVGIGTTGPGAPLHIYSTQANQIILERTSAANTNIQYTNTAGTMYAGLNPTAGWAIGPNLDLANSPFVTVAVTSGNVGIGTTTPGAKLHVGDSAITGGGDISTMSILSGNTSYPLTVANTANRADGNVNRISFDFGASSWSSTAFMGAVIENVNTAATGLAFGTYNGGLSEKVRITSGGNVGIGTTGPTARLTIWDNTSDESQMIRLGGSATGDYRIFRQRADGILRFDGTQTTYSGFLFSTPAAASALSILYNGNVGIGTTAPTQKLDVVGNVNINTNGTAALFSTYHGADTDANNIWIGGGGQSSLGAVGATWRGALNTSVGINALLADTTGYRNTAIGTYAFQANTTGYFGTAIGSYALNSNVTGNYNTAVGSEALQYITTNSNTALGTQAGKYITDGSTPNATSTNSLYLGYDTRALSDGRTNEIVIGSSAIGLGSNTVVLGNSSIITTALRGNVGIGTTAPNDKLVVNGASGIRITGDASYQANLVFGNTDTWKSGIRVYDNGDAEMRIWHANAVGQIVLATGYNGDEATTMPADGLFIDQNKVGIGYASPAGATGKLVVNGNVGIGTTSPSSLLEVNKTQNAETALKVRNLYTGAGGVVKLSVGYNDAASLDIFRNYGDGDFYFNTTQSGADYRFQNAGSDLVTFKAGGNVGIGTTAPAYKLDVNGSVRGDIYYDSSSASYYLDPANAGTSLNTAGDIVIAGGAGKLDVGTVDPPYTINGKKYATYLPSMTGIKEETTGKIILNIKDVDTKTYYQTIDFNNQPDGSDLWLFSKTTNLKNNINDLTVLLSNSSNSKVWYKVDETNFKLTFFSNSPTEVSYRLTAPRFDSDKWANVRDQNDPVPGLVINDQGEVINPSPSVAINKAELSNNQDYIYNGNLEDFKQANSLYKLTGDFIEEFISINEALIARIKAGFIEAENIIVNNTLIAKNAILETVVAKIINSEKIRSPIVETEKIIATGTAQLNTIATNEIKPQSGDLTIDLSSPVIPAEAGIQTFLDPLLQGDDNGVEKGTLARLIIKGLEGKTVTTIDSEGNASFSGQIIADSLQINTDATVAGNLAADSLSVRNANLRSLQSNDASISGKLIAGEIESSTINDIQALLADIKNQPIPNLTNETNLTNVSNLESLIVTGNSNLYNVSVSNSLLVGTTLIDQNSIISLVSELKLSALSTINLFDGAVIIAKDGKITTRGEIIAEGGIRTNEIKALTDTGRVAIDNLTTNNLAIADKYLEATTSASIIAAADNFDINGIFAPAIETASASAGIGILPENSAEIIIYNQDIKKDSLVYLTPTSDAPTNSQLTVGQKEDCVQQSNNLPAGRQGETIKQCKPYFKIITNTPSTLPIKFNWLIIN